LVASSMNRRVPSSAISFGSTEGWAAKSKSANLNGDGSGHAFHGEWNYTIGGTELKPRRKRTTTK